MMKIATSTYDFATLRQDGFVYVDKTDILLKLIRRGGDAHYFIARPRRFGKSLMLSTLKYIFQGRRELFKGLAIDRARYDWKNYPVIHFDMCRAAADAPEKVDRLLLNMVKDSAAQYKIKLNWREVVNSSEAFNRFLSALAAEHGKFVVLIDEYDVPLQGFLGDRKSIAKVRKIMHDFYVQLKSHAADIRFMMIAGVTKLTKLSLFSGLNNPNDLSNDGTYGARLLGYTGKEIEKFFGRRIRELAKKRKVLEKEFLRQILKWYDSYRFSPNSKVKVCNPISVGKSLNEGVFSNYWMKTASTSLLVERMQSAALDDFKFENVLTTSDDLDVCDAIELPLIPLMYQCGYLTIKDVQRNEDGVETGLVLGVPNMEVRSALDGLYFKSMLHVDERDFDSGVTAAAEFLAAGDMRRLVGEALYSIYAKIPPTWRIKCEADAKRHFMLFMQMLGAKTAAEKPSAFGYADAILETKTAVCLFEFKFNKSVKSAVRQIRDKRYAESYRGDKRAVKLIGVNFRSSKRNIDEPLIEDL